MSDIFLNNESFLTFTFVSGGLVSMFNKDNFIKQVLLPNVRLHKSRYATSCVHTKLKLDKLSINDIKNNNKNNLSLSSTYHKWKNRSYINNVNIKIINSSQQWITNELFRVHLIDKLSESNCIFMFYDMNKIKEFNNIINLYKEYINIHTNQARKQIFFMIAIKDIDNINDDINIIKNEIKKIIINNKSIKYICYDNGMNVKFLKGIIQTTIATYIYFDDNNQKYKFRI